MHGALCVRVCLWVWVCVWTSHTLPWRASVKGRYPSPYHPAQTRRKRAAWPARRVSERTAPRHPQTFPVSGNSLLGDTIKGCWVPRASVYPVCKSGRAGWGGYTPPRGEAKQSSPLHVTVWRNLQAGNAAESQSGSVTIIPDYQRHDDKTVIKDTLRQTDPRAQIKCLTVSNGTKPPFPPVGVCPFSYVSSLDLLADLYRE